MPCDPRLGAKTGGQLAGNQPYCQHDAKGQQVLHIADREGESRRHEKEVEGTDAEHRRERGRSSAIPHTHQHHSQNIYGNDIGTVEVFHQGGGQ